MRKIEVVEKPCKGAIFSIDRFAFKLSEDAKRCMIKYQIDLELKNYQPIDVRFLLEDMDSTLEFLLPTPEEVTKYISQYDEKNDPSDECLFHDIRTKYIEFIKNPLSESNSIRDELIILGFSLYNEKICLIIKTFSFKALFVFWEKLTSYCLDKTIVFNVPDDIRWLKLNQFLLDTSEHKNIGITKDFLSRTLVEDNFSRFREIFQQIDNEGYFGKKFYDRVMFQKKKISEEKELRVPINQISKFFSPYWKYQINTSDKNKAVLCLHDEMPSDETVNDYVYTFKPSLMKYYLQNWFEDFTIEIIKRIEFEGMQLKHLLSSRKFNFFGDGVEDNIREIDAIMEIEKAGIVKLIAIECKKTLSAKEIQTTNKKCREKVINSGNNVFDAFIHIGCFIGDVEFEKKIEGTRAKYKQSIIEGSDKNMDVPYYAFAISSINDYEMKLKYIINDIFANW